MEIYITQDVRVNRPLIVVTGDNKDIGMAKVASIQVTYLNYDKMEIRKEDLYESIVDKWGGAHWANKVDESIHLVWFDTERKILASMTFDEASLGKRVSINIRRSLPLSEVIKSSAEKARDLLR